ncbi:hypothetical protein TREMEDRAFT_27395, partial [Tremella mesenterica DSM 1558]|uniref:uncharacterized protein n=1 Tax=Tremella mesenterica (strain ATCC 24925 / CBS 8224 / DSM 1558 / NBRC 9311 / NRRL Y-6157 / RJB 2259-6 / UBC 559-6) TaxID=578456 RepID=UPI0003F49A2C
SDDPASFQSLRNKVDHRVLRALTVDPWEFKQMTEVQQRVLSLMPELAGRSLGTKEAGPDMEGLQSDLLVKARTGTGKTVAFLVPALEARLNSLRGREGSKISKGVGVLIISPTRELASQIAKDAKRVSHWHRSIEVVLLTGGESKRDQLKAFRKGRDIVVATPGRLNDLIETNAQVRDSIEKTATLILDEADTLLDMGFARELKSIVESLPQDRQTFLFSATVSKEIRGIAKEFLKPNHHFIDCVPANESNVHHHIPQYANVLPSAAEQLPQVLRLIAHDQLINTTTSSKIIVFLPTTKMTMLFSTLLRELANSLPVRPFVSEIHSGLSQDRRSRTSERFRNDKGPSILVTSDVSARGVDYPGVTRVIQVGVPSSGEQYIHRVGRTGRAQAEGGRGDIILMPWEQGFLRELHQVPLKTQTVKDLEEENQRLANSRSMAEKVAALPNAVQQLFPSLDPTALEEVFTAQLGFYVGRTRELGLSPEDILEELKEWSVGAMGLAEPPHLSSDFLSKLGIGRGGGRGGRGGRFVGRRPSRTKDVQSTWLDTHVIYTPKSLCRLCHLC